jgi:Zn-dependent protease with chaperone function
MRRLVAFVVVLVVAAALPAPALAADPDPAAIDRGSEVAYRRALAVEAGKKTLNADAAAAQRLRRIANRLVGAAPAVAPASRGYHWEVNVRADPAADVRAYPGGRLLISDGLATRTGMRDDEVAAVLAHAIAQLLLGHDVARIVAAAGPIAPSPDPNRETLAWADAIAESMRAPRYGAAEIAAADRMSAELMARAAYDPRALGSAWRELARTKSGIVVAVPVTDARLAALDAAALAAVPLYEEALARAAAAPPGVRPPTGAPPRGGPPPMR